MRVTHEEFLDRLPTEAPDFGELQEVYPKNPLELLDRTVWGNLAVGILCILFALGVAAIRVLAPSSDSGAVNPTFHYSIVGLGLIFALIGVCLLIYSLLLRGKPVSAVGRYWMVFPKGLIVLNNGKFFRAYPNEEMRIIKRPLVVKAAAPAERLLQQAFIAITPDDFQLRDGNNERIRVPPFVRTANVVIRAINENITRQQLPVYKSKIAKGERIEFGKVEVSQSALYYAGKEIPFSRINGIRIYVPDKVDFKFKDGLRMDVLSAGGAILAEVPAYKEMYNVWLFIRLVNSLYPDLISQKKSIRALVT